ncbi:thaumatin-like protein 1b isoform X2 [Corylus avellana]|uniref:thaumatin-like protein 1b isoform X2 n=1 Tax=Corylus avellana TaxID=13451 RepID=UPI002869F24D|nr:thaumatin-like protein 1b isoform X2 [Corylus avellana]
MGRRLLLSGTALIILLTISSLAEVRSDSFKIVNNCLRTIWPALQTTGVTGQFPTTGFALKSGESKNISILTPWNGRIWGRTHCGQDSSGNFTCLTGDCGSGALECGGVGYQPPVTLAEFGLNSFEGLDFYDVTAFDGFNLPMLVVPEGTSRGTCGTTGIGCLVDLNGPCRKLLSVTRGDGREGVVACRNPFEYKYSDTPSLSPIFRQSLYLQFFKSACPRAYTEPFDDKIAVFTCDSANYIITFCPSPNTGKTTE